MTESELKRKQVVQSFLEEFHGKTKWCPASIVREFVALEMDMFLELMLQDAEDEEQRTP